MKAREILAGLGLNLYQSASIYRNMIAEARYPEHLFQGSPRTLDELRAAKEEILQQNAELAAAKAMMSLLS